MFNWMRDPIEEKMISPEDYTLREMVISAVQERNSAYKSCMSAALHYKAPE